MLFAGFTPRLIAVQQCFRDTAMPDHLVPQVACDSLSAIAPEDNFLLHATRRTTFDPAFE
jgi:hypothetical protein